MKNSRDVYRRKLRGGLMKFKWMHITGLLLAGGMVFSGMATAQETI
jgi:hypothetical protein